MNKLSNLARMDLTSNFLSEIPKCISEMSQLRHLILKYNSITSISKGFKFPSNLRTLDLSENHLKELPEDVFSDSLELQQLNLFSNRLHSLPPSIVKLINLSSLDVTQNYIQRLPKDFCSLANLEIVMFYFSLNSVIFD
jgi:internalin A